MRGVKVVGLTKSFGEVRAVRSASIEVPAGQIAALLGPSGCGKTTLLRCLAGLESPDSGEIAVDGRLLYSSEKKLNVAPEKRGLGFVFQSYAIWPHMTVFDNVAYGLRINKTSRAEIKARVTRVLDLVGLGDLGNRHPGTLSGGQQQRVAMARSLVTEPPVVLLDEPMSNLDAVVREQMREYLRVLIKELSITAILVTHDHSEALVLADQVYVMDSGEIVEAGEPMQIYHRPRTRRGALGVGRANMISVISLTRNGNGTAVARLGESGISLRVAMPTPDEPAGMTSQEPGSGTVALMVRPSHVTIAAAQGGGADGGVNVFPAVVRNSFFLGTSVLYDVEWAGGRLRVDGPGDSEITEADVTICIDPRALVVVQED